MAYKNFTTLSPLTGEVLDEKNAPYFSDRVKYSPNVDYASVKRCSCKTCKNPLRSPLGMIPLSKFNDRKSSPDGKAKCCIMCEREASKKSRRKCGVGIKHEYDRTGEAWK